MSNADTPGNRFPFTVPSVRAIKPPTTGRAEYYDEDQTGLMLRVSAPIGPGTPAKAVYYLYKWSKVYGPIRRKLGDASDLSPTEARRKARELIVEIEGGKNPNEAERVKAIQARETIADLWNAYHTQHHPECKPSTVRVDVLYYEIYILGRPHRSNRKENQPVDEVMPAGLSKRAVRSITPAEAKALHAKITEDGGPNAADEVIGLLCRLYNYSGILPNPFVTRGRKAQASDRDRDKIRRHGKKSVVKYLTRDTYRALMGSLDEDSDQEVADLVRIALFTGQRRENVRLMRWEEIDLHLHLWRIPAEKFKTNKQADTPLTPQAVEVLKNRLASRPDGSPWVFHSRVDPQRPRRGLNKQLRRIYQRAGLDDWRFHDLRHACASAIVMSGGSLAQAGRQLNHANAASTERYAHLDAKSVAAVTAGAFAALGSAAKKISKPKKGKKK